ncbi:MAG: DUF4198 domain-containing protein [Hyphomonadaceae bacterium]
MTSVSKTPFKAVVLRVAAVASMALATAGVAHAHRAWMLPSTFTLSGEEQYVTVDGAVSNDLFFPNHVPMRLDNVKVTAPDGSVAAIENPSTGKFRSVFDLHLTQQGTYRLSDSGAGYFATWTENGKPQRRRGSLEDFKAAGLVGKPGVEIRQNIRRVETYVTLGAPTMKAFEPTGKGLELQPVTHPNDVYVGEAVTFKLLANGKPAQNIEVDIVRGEDRYRDEAGVIKVKTGADGSFSFTLDQAGRYWMSSSSRVSTKVEGVPMEGSLSYTGTFEALAP